MLIIRDYECLCGHTFEAYRDNHYAIEHDRPLCPMCYGRAHAVLSPTTTTFKFADTSARKHRQ